MDLASYIDHTILKADATAADVKRVCDEALKHHFAAVCVNPCFVVKAAAFLKGSDVGLATVIGFPLGALTTKTKVEETKEAVLNGATEIDMVMNVGLFKGKDYREVEDDIREVVKAAGGKPVKVIIETCYLSPEEITKASQIAVSAGAQFVKTSTGFGSRGASVKDVQTIKSAINDKAKIKASGGIKTKDQVLAMIEAGAARIGTSSGIKIISVGV